MIPPPAIGVDIEPLARWRAKAASLSPGGTLHRLFDAHEHAWAGRFRDPLPHYAGFWCAREAAAKALRAFARVGPRRLHVAHTADGRPSIVLPAALAGQYVIDISISHAGDVAVGAAIVLPSGPAEPRPHSR